MLCQIVVRPQLKNTKIFKFPGSDICIYILAETVPFSNITCRNCHLHFVLYKQ